MKLSATFFLSLSARLLLPALLFLTLAASAQPEIELKPGMVISRSARIKPGIYHLDAFNNLDTSAITITGDTTTVDFSGATLIGSSGRKSPDQFYGICIRVVRGKSIIVKNVNIRGYKVAIYASEIRGLQFQNCDMSYNYRSQLKSTALKEDPSDKLDYKLNDQDEWLQQGAGMYLRICNFVIIKGCTVHNGQNGLMLNLSNNNTIYNNDFSFNSGVGMALYRSGNNKIHNNKLDFNVRAFSFGHYATEARSAGLMALEQSNGNTIAYNSMTHCGSGVIQWFGRFKLVSGVGGYSGNLFYGNEFVNEANSGLELASIGKVINNRIENCQDAIIGVNSEQYSMVGNQIKNCQNAISIFNGNNNSIFFNRIENCHTGLRIWQDMSRYIFTNYNPTPEEYISHDYKVVQNFFNNIPLPLEVNSTKNANINGNQFVNYDTLLIINTPNDTFNFERNKFYDGKSLGKAADYKATNEVIKGTDFQPPYAGSAITAFATDKEPDSKDVMMPATALQGKQYIVVDEWGPWDFKRPIAHVKSARTDQGTEIEILGPAGQWKVVSKNGVKSISVDHGQLPAPTTIVAKKDPNELDASIEFEYTGEAVTTAFGDEIAAGSPYRFTIKL